MTEDDVAAILGAIERATILELAGLMSLAEQRLSAMRQVDRLAGSVALPTPPEPALRPDATAATIKIYAAGAPGLLALCRSLGGVPVHKIGTTRQANPALRVDALSRGHYGGFDSQGGVVRRGFGEYVLIPFGCTTKGELPTGIRHVGGCFEIDLPGAMAHASFEAAFRRALAPLLLMTWAQSGAGLAQLAASGLTIADLPGATRLSGRAVRADEFYLVQPRRQADLVLEAIKRALQSPQARSNGAGAPQTLRQTL